MADNLHAVNLDNPMIPQSENFSDENIPTNDLKAIITNQETENMELHKHLHHVTYK